MSSILRKVLIGGLAALTFGLAVAETSTPALAFRGSGFHGGFGGFHGGWGRGGWGRGGWGRGGWGWGAAGLGLGALAVGAAAYPYYGYGYPYGGGCWQQQPVYDAYGYFRGYRPVAVC
jgi:hypothetical protein